MRTSLTIGLSLVLTIAAVSTAMAVAAPATPAAPTGAGATGNQPYTMYSSIPRVPGIKTLINFNDYDEIIAAAKGYVNVRYLPTGGAIPGVDGHSEAAVRVGAETGMPVVGWVLDPVDSNGNSDPDTHALRQLTVIGDLFATSDPARAGDAYASVINPPAAGGAAGATAEAPSYADLPKDRFGSIEYTISKEDLDLDNWLVELNSSAATIQNRRHSYAKKVTNFSGDTDFLGVRIRFPQHSYNAHARIAPAYPFPAFDARGYPINYGFFDPQAGDSVFGANGAVPTHTAVGAARERIENLAGDPALAGSISYNGVIHNVSDIREIVVRVAGRNYRNGVAIRLRDQNGDTSEHFLGYLDFVGWRTLRWVNPNYIPAEEQEAFRLPLYPSEIPYIAFDSFVVYRNGEELGGDFVTYFDYVKIDYDLAVPASQLDVSIPDFIDIADDQWWYIIRDRNQANFTAMMRQFSSQIDLRRQALGRSIRHSEGEAPVENAAFQPRREYTAAAATTTN